MKENWLNNKKYNELEQLIVNNYDGNWMRAASDIKQNWSSLPLHVMSSRVKAVMRGMVKEYNILLSIERRCRERQLTSERNRRKEQYILKQMCY